MFEDLPSTLRIKLIGHKYFREIQTIHLFRNSDIDFVSQLVIRSKPYHALAGEIIYDMRDVAEEMTFILRGSVRIIINDGHKDVLVGYSTAGGFFGDFEFYKKSIRTARYEAAENCSLLAIEYSHFITAIEDYPDHGRKFMIRLKRRFQIFSQLKNEPTEIKSGAQLRRTSYGGGSVRKKINHFVDVVQDPLAQQEIKYKIERKKIAKKDEFSRFVSHSNSDSKNNSRDFSDPRISNYKNQSSIHTINRHTLTLLAEGQLDDDVDNNLKNTTVQNTDTGILKICRPIIRRMSLSSPSLWGKNSNKSPTTYIKEEIKSSTVFFPSIRRAADSVPEILDNDIPHNNVNSILIDNDNNNNDNNDTQNNSTTYNENKSDINNNDNYGNKNDNENNNDDEDENKNDTHINNDSHNSTNSANNDDNENKNENNNDENVADSNNYNNNDSHITPHNYIDTHSDSDTDSDTHNVNDVQISPLKANAPISHFILTDIAEEETEIIASENKSEPEKKRIFGSKDLGSNDGTDRHGIITPFLPLILSPFTSIGRVHTSGESEMKYAKCEKDISTVPIAISTSSNRNHCAITDPPSLRGMSNDVGALNSKSNSHSVLNVHTNISSNISNTNISSANISNTNISNRNISSANISNTNSYSNSTINSNSNSNSYRFQQSLQRLREGIEVHTPIQLSAFANSMMKRSNTGISSNNSSFSGALVRRSDSTPMFNSGAQLWMDGELSMEIGRAHV